MTEPTYYARIGNEAEKEVAEFLRYANTYGASCPFEAGDLLVRAGHGSIFIWKKTWAIAPDDKWIEISLSELIRRFVPLSVIGALAECHGMGLTSLGYLATHPAAQIEVDGKGSH